MAERGWRVGMPPLGSVALVAAGGAVGGLSRAVLKYWFPTPEGAFPLTTWSQNVAGAYLLTILVTLLLEQAIGQSWVRPLVGTGLLGAFTTFATLAFELQGLWVGGDHGMLAAYAAATTAGGLVAVGLGVSSARAWLRLRHRARR